MTTVNQDPIPHPLNIVNWPQAPKTLQDLEQQWLPATRANLHRWLKDATARAQDETARSQIHKYTEAVAAAWQNLEPEADLETGVLPSDSAVHQDAAMKTSLERLAQAHQSLETSKTTQELRWAQAAWEDHLFYQNSWNRRGFTPPNQEKSGAGITSSTQETSSTEQLYWSWKYDMIGWYHMLGLGNRENMPDLVGVDSAHRYSQSIRGTTQIRTKSYRRRHDYLQSKFAAVKRTKPNSEQGAAANVTVTVDESLRNSSEVEGEESEENTAWTLDEAAFVQKKNRIDSKYLDDPKTKTLLPSDHALHHGALETSFDWPTSFDDDEGDDSIAVTAKKRKYVYETEQYQDIKGRTRRRRKKDAEGHHIRSRETCGYRRVGQTMQVESFIHNLNEDGSVHGRNENGIWGGQQGQKSIMEYELEGGAREPDLRYRIQNKFKVVKVKAPWPIVTRYQRHVHASNKLGAGADNDPSGKSSNSDSEADDDPLDQLSDAEAHDCIKSNPNFRHSGNEMGIAASYNTKLAVVGNEDYESDDDGDAFRSSYLEDLPSVGNNT